MFHEGIEEYAMSNTSLVSTDIQTIATDTGAQELFSPCMVGTLESQFLKLQVQVSGAKKVLDIGTFTGMSALAMAEGLPKDGKVTTIECSDDCADVAEACFKKAKHGQKVTLLRGNAVTIMKEMLESKYGSLTLIKSKIHMIFLKSHLNLYFPDISISDDEKFDVIFIDADKENYIEYYKLSMEGLLSSNGYILADNSMCALLYDTTDFRSKKLHEFNQYVKNDSRVEQVILTIREGITMIKPIPSGK